MGTTLYMSPEQARGQEVDARSDVWSLGCVLYEMLAGRAPFEGETHSHVVVSILDEEPPPLAAQGQTVIPAELEAVVLKALRKKRVERYQKSEEMVAALRHLKQELEIAAAQQDSDQAKRRTMNLDAASAPTISTETNEEAQTPTVENFRAQTAKDEARQTTVIATEHPAGASKRLKGTTLAILAALTLVAFAGRQAPCLCPQLFT